MPIAIDPAQRDQDLVFQANNGNYVNPHNLDRKFVKLIEKAGVKRISFHGLRHTHATHFLAGGENIKAVSERLGHASITITLQTYAHVLPKMQRQAALTIDRVLFGTI